MSNKKIFSLEIQKIVECIKKKYYPQKIILFGSFAKGEFKEGGDLDFFILKASNKSHHQRLVDIYRLIDGIERKHPVDFVVYTPKELKQRLALGDFFVKNILEEGKILYDREKSS